MSAGCLGLALLALAGGLLGRAGGIDGVPPGPGLGGWRVGVGIFLPLDLGIVALLVGIYGVLPLAGTLMMSGHEPEEGAAGISTWALAVNALMQLLLMGMVVALVAWRQRPGEWLGLRWRPVVPPLAMLLVIGVGLLATLATGYFVVGLDAVGYQEWLLRQLGHAGQEEAMQDVVKAFAEAESALLLGMLCVTAVVVAPVTEEVIFRGYVYPVAKRFAGRWAGLAFSSLFFAMVHQNAMALLPLAFLALLLALAYEFTGSIWVPVGMHMVFNASTVAAQIAQRYGWIELPQG